MMTALMAAIGLTGSAAYFSPWLWRQYRMRRVRSEVTKNRILALTYDDGPSPALTPQLLDLLRDRNARATFFLLGRQAQQYPHIVDRVIREGHDVGCHTDQHLHAWLVPPWEAVADINAGYERLSSWMRPDGTFRPPYGKVTLPTYWSLRRRGAPVWWWTIDSGDSLATLPSLSHVADRLRKEGGGIVLLHDGSLTERSHDRNNYTLAASAALLDIAKQEGISIVTLRDLWK